MTREYCDICGRAIIGTDCAQYKIKKRSWLIFGWSGWENLLVHKNCWREMCKIVEQKKEALEKEGK